VHACEQLLGLAIEQFEDLLFELAVAERHLCEMGDIDRRACGRDRRQRHGSRFLLSRIPKSCRLFGQDHAPKPTR
jgi:hypothetical protein